MICRRGLAISIGEIVRPCKRKVVDMDMTSRHSMGGGIYV